MEVCIQSLFANKLEFEEVQKVMRIMRVKDHGETPTSKLIEESTLVLEKIEGDKLNELWAMHFRYDIMRIMHIISLSYNETYNQIQKKRWFDEFLRRHPLLDVAQSELSPCDHDTYKINS